MMSFDDTLTRANFSFVYLLQFYLLIFLTFFNGGVWTPQTPPLATPLRHRPVWRANSCIVLLHSYTQTPR